MKRHARQARFLAAALFIAGATPICVAAAADAPIAATSAATPLFIKATSADDFAATLQRLTTAIEKRNLRIFATIDHAAGARSIGEDLRPTTLVIFGNPAGGTPLMQAAQTMGFDLPLKALVWEDAAGAVHLAYTDIERVAALHGDAPSSAPIASISGLLAQIEREATSGQPTDE